MDSRNFITSLQVIGTKIQAFQAVIVDFQITVSSIRPALTPYLAVLLLVLVYSVLLVSTPIPRQGPEAFTIFNLPLIITIYWFLSLPAWSPGYRS